MQIKLMRLTLGLIVSVMFAWAIPAQARDFKVYGYKTPDQGEVELVYWWDYFVQSDMSYEYFGKVLKKEGLQRHSFEIEYGLTDHWTVSAYADFEKPEDGNFEYVQARAVVTRYRFFEAGERLMDSAVYVEYYLPYKKYRENEKIETRVILEKNFGPLAVILNPILDKNLSGDDVEEGMEFEYAAGIYYQVTPWLKPGVEFYGEMGELSDLKPKDKQEHFIFPTAKVKLPHHMGLEVGYGFGLTNDSDDQVIKVILELALE
jgi:hypothetical protein